jgi:hypothetical protein
MAQGVFSVKNRMVKMLHCRNRFSISLRVSQSVEYLEIKMVKSRAQIFSGKHLLKPAGYLENKHLDSEPLSRNLLKAMEMPHQTFNQLTKLPDLHHQQVAFSSQRKHRTHSL